MVPEDRPLEPYTVRIENLGLSQRILRAWMKVDLSDSSSGVADGIQPVEVHGDQFTGGRARYPKLCFQVLSS